MLILRQPREHHSKKTQSLKPFKNRVDMFRMFSRRATKPRPIKGICTGCVMTKEGLTFHPYLHPYENLVKGGHFCPDCLDDFDVKRLIITTKSFTNGRNKKSQRGGQQHLVLNR